MTKRGRRSAAELAITSVVTIEPRPVAPNDLGDEEAAEWEQSVARMPGGWMGREQQPLLAQYCRHAVAARRLAQLIAGIEHGEGDFDEERWLRLRRAEVQQSAMLAALASKLRIAHSARYGAQGSDDRYAWQSRQEALGVTCCRAGIQLVLLRRRAKGIRRRRPTW